MELVIGVLVGLAVGGAAAVLLSRYLLSRRIASSAAEHKACELAEPPVIATDNGQCGHGPGGSGG